MNGLKSEIVKFPRITRTQYRAKPCFRFMTTENRGFYRVFFYETEIRLHEKSERR